MGFLWMLTAGMLVTLGIIHPLLALIPLAVGLIVGGIPWLALRWVDRQNPDGKQ